MWANSSMDDAPANISVFIDENDKRFCDPSHLVTSVIYPLFFTSKRNFRSITSFPICRSTLTCIKKFKVNVGFFACNQIIRNGWSKFLLAFENTTFEKYIFILYVSSLLLQWPCCERRLESWSMAHNFQIFIEFLKGFDPLFCASTGTLPLFVTEYTNYGKLSHEFFHTERNRADHRTLNTCYEKD